MSPTDQPTTCQPPVPARPASGTVLWIIAILLAVIATALWTGGRSPSTYALAQDRPLVGARGVFAFSGPIDRDRYGLFMLDVDQGTIWCYAFDETAGATKLRLVAARTWIYDRYLRDFNCAPPDFRAVRQLVNQQRAEGDERNPATTVDSQPEAPPD